MAHDSGYYVLKTLGCKANLYDSQLIEAELQRRGWRPLPGEADEGREEPVLCIVNSCTVTDEADRQSRKLASRLGREHPGSRVVVTGCGAEVDPERLARSAGIHYVVGNQDKPRLVELIVAKLAEERSAAASTQAGQVLGSVSGYEDMASRHPMDREWPATSESFLPPPVGISGHASKTRAFLKVQEGCNSFCTYCVIPYGRGPSRSLRPREIIEHARGLVAQGVREIVLTGTNIGDFGVDWGLDPGAALTELVEGILRETGIGRLRVGSLDPVEITPALVDLMERDERFCPHFHVSLQASQDRILKLMKRKYGLKQVRECLERIARVRHEGGGAFIGMDVITGFPGESERDFEAGIEELSRLPWSRLHVFPYSEREGTPATRLPGAVPKPVRAERARRLNELSLGRLEAHYRRLPPGSVLEGILMERPQERLPDAWRGRSLEEACALAGLPLERRSELVWANGYTPNYLRTLIPMARDRAEALRNQLFRATVVDVITEPASGEAFFVGRER